MIFYDLHAAKRNGEDFSFDSLKGKVVLVVNTATGCGFTPQYDGLEKLFETYNEQGLEILDFPCNQFANQAPGTDEEIHQFCTLKFNTKFEQFSKVEVNGENESEVFTFLKNAAQEDITGSFKDKVTMKAIEKLSSTYKKPSDIKWNFTKFLVDRSGNVVKRYAPTVTPKKIEEDIKNLL
ncbi:MAG: glutathione peroxidase [Clostridia bacterium]|nr:glutathione peroxidase [Clostridia bacterium]